MMRLQRVWLVVIVVATAACTGPDVAAPTTVDDGTTSTSVPLEVTAPPVDDPAALCHGYLVLLRTGDDRPLRDALAEDADLLADLDVMLSEEGEFEAIAQAAFRVEEALVERCETRFAAGVEPAPDDETALTWFFEALIAGDEEVGARVALANVVAQLSPWATIDHPAGPDYAVEGGAGSVALSPTVSVTCRAEDGVVVSCVFGE